MYRCQINIAASFLALKSAVVSKGNSENCFHDELAYGGFRV